MVTNPSSEAFARKISSFAEMRLTPLLSGDDLRRLTAFMLGLVRNQSFPPMQGDKVDWPEVCLSCGLQGVQSAKLKRVGQHGFDAIVRWLKDKVGDAVPHQRKSHSFAFETVESEKAVRHAAAASNTFGRSGAKRGAKPKPVATRPAPLFEIDVEPVSFQAAFELQLRRFGETYYHMHKALIQEGCTIDATTALAWLKGTKVPRNVDSMQELAAIETRYGLPNGYFKAKLPHQARSSTGHKIGDEISPSERRRFAWHLPDDFNRLSFEKREEILEWVRRVIISGATDYRKFQAAASKQRYAIRFPAMAYGGRATGNPIEQATGPSANAAGDIDDPDLLSGVIDAPPRLVLAMASLISFKTATLTEIGFQRNGVWGEETASQKLEHLGLMLGALAASPRGEIAGRGIALGSLTFGLLIFPGIWDWYLQWRERRRGFFTRGVVSTLSVSTTKRNGR
jgi:hypothetical protein